MTGRPTFSGYCHMYAPDNEIRPEGGEQKRPATVSGGRPSGPSESRQEQDLATDVPAPGLPVPEIKRTILVEVGPHECVTCQRCATTFAAVHPACPSCSQEFRLRADNERLREAAQQALAKADAEGLTDATHWVRDLRAALAAPEGATDA